MWTISEIKDWKTLADKFELIRIMEEVPQDPCHHAEGNVAIHTQMVLAAMQQLPAYQTLPVEQQEVLWTACLLHDIEKHSTTERQENGSITAHGHARKGAITTRQMLYVSENPAPFFVREQIVALVRYHGLPIWLLEKGNPVKEVIKAAMEVDLRLLATLARADVLGRICTDQQELLYRIDCFEEFCKEQQCWGTPFPFESDHARMNYLLGDASHPGYTPFLEPAMTVTMLSGLPGAGKDNYIKRNLQHLPVVSLDSIRGQMKIAPTDSQGNGTVIQAAKEAARGHLRKKRSFVWNATNITRQLRGQLIDLFTSYGAGVNIVYVEVPYRQLNIQNKDRLAVVPGAALEKLIRKLEVPAPWEAQDVRYHVDHRENKARHPS